MYIYNLRSFCLLMQMPKCQWPDVPIRTLIKGVKKFKNVLLKFEEYREYYDFQENVVDECICIV